MGGVIIALFLVALIPAFIAQPKGRSFFPWYVYGLALWPFAFIHALIIKPNEFAKDMKKCSECSSIISLSAKRCPMCNFSFEENQTKNKMTIAGKIDSNEIYDKEASLEMPEYQLFLINKYSITKNDILSKYITCQLSFDKIEDALSHVNKIEQKIISERKENLAKFTNLIESGKIGQYNLNYSVFEDGHVVVNHAASAWKKSFTSIEEAITDQGKTTPEYKASHD